MSIRAFVNDTGVTNSALHDAPTRPRDAGDQGDLRTHPDQIACVFSLKDRIDVLYLARGVAFPL
jgi:hypothetical protein